MASFDAPYSPDSVDLTNCDREPIHLLGRVQPFGALLAFSRDWVVRHVSRNAAELLELGDEPLLGRQITEIFRADAIHDIRTHLQMLATSDSVERMFGMALTDGGAPFDVAVHMSGEYVIVEAERHKREAHASPAAKMRPVIERIAQATTIEQLCEQAARQLKGMTGFDRVMVYRFATDGTGEVVAESREHTLEPFLGLRYPASDIPKQARELYKRNLIRIISDVNHDGIPVEPGVDEDGKPLDLSLSVTRAVSPIHLEYLRNMGVGASMSVSILKRGELWGLFACHHYSPLVVPFEERSALELFGQLFSFLLDQKESDIEREHTTRARTLHNRLMAQFADGSSIIGNFDSVVASIGEVIPFDGAAVWVNGRFRTRGETLTEEEFARLAPFLNAVSGGQIFTTDKLAKLHPPAADYADRVAGILALPLSRTPRDYLVLFRREIVKLVTWGGKPEKNIEYGPNGPRLTPRKSFEAWQETAKGTSAPWTDADQLAAEKLRVTLLEVILRMADMGLRERSRAHDRQEMLIAELNHRVRNILNLTKSLVTQSQKSAENIEDFTEMVDGRINALARAHNLVTQHSWSAASLRDLIATEAEAYLNEEAARITVSGPDALLEPAAFTTISLVLHELMTNAVKYGALSRPEGALEIALAEEEGGSLVIHWRESGVTGITRPSRKGFGTTIIERSVPYDLGGEAEVTFTPEGLNARFLVPGRHVPAFPPAETAARLGEDDEHEIDLHIDGNALLVEDNMVIAMDAEDLLEEFGASNVFVAATVAEALDILETETVHFAMLDVNLGSESSEEVARALAGRQIPFVFATGYGDLRQFTGHFPAVPVVTKPFAKRHVAEAIEQAYDTTPVAAS